MNPGTGDLHREMRRLGLVIIVGVVLLFAGVITWASVARIDTAVVSVGEIRPGQSRLVQQVESGRIDKLLVHDGDSVTVGQTLFVLQDDGRRAELDLITLTHQELLVRRAYLKARVNEAQTLSLPPEVNEAAQVDPLRSIVAEYRSMLNHDDDTLGSTRRIIQKRLDAQESSTSRAADRMDDLDAAIDNNQDKLSELDTSKPDEAFQAETIGQTIESLKAQRDNAAEAKESSKSTEGDLEAQLAAEDDNTEGEIQSEIAAVEADIAESVVQRDQALEDTRRLTVKAPSNGIVHEARPLARGDMIAPGESAIEVIPAAEDRLASVRIPAADVDAVAVGGSVAIKLSAFAPGVVPDLTGTTTKVASAPDIDAESGASTYLVHVRIKAADLARLPRPDAVVAGMPIEAFFNVGETQVLSYLVAPLLDQIRRSAPG